MGLSLLHFSYSACDSIVKKAKPRRLPSARKTHDSPFFSRVDLRQCYKNHMSEGNENVHELLSKSVIALSNDFARTL